MVTYVLNFYSKILDYFYPRFFEKKEWEQNQETKKENFGGNAESKMRDNSDKGLQIYFPI